MAGIAGRRRRHDPARSTFAREKQNTATVRSNAISRSRGMSNLGTALVYVREYNWRIFPCRWQGPSRKSYTARVSRCGLRRRPNRGVVVDKIAQCKSEFQPGENRASLCSISTSKTIAATASTPSPIWAIPSCRTLQWRTSDRPGYTFISHRGRTTFETPMASAAGYRARARLARTRRLRYRALSGLRLRLGSALEF